MTTKICINTRDELTILSLEKIAYVQAAGNYSTVVYIGGMKLTITMGLSKLESLLSQAYPKKVRSPFIRLGRSLIINRNFLYAISALRNTLWLSDFDSKILKLEVSKNLLKALKEHLKMNNPIKVVSGADAQNTDADKTTESNK